jgi:hypothetical protein
MRTPLGNKQNSSTFIALSRPLRPNYMLLLLLLLLCLLEEIEAEFVCASEGSGEWAGEKA